MLRKIVPLFLLAWAAMAQGVYVGGGPSAYASTTPHLAGDFMVGVCTATEATCSLTNVEGRSSLASPNTINYAVESGVKQRLALVVNESFSAELFSLAMAGGDIGGTATAGVFSGGGGVAFRAAKYPNWSLIFAVRAAYSPINPGWQPWGNIQAGYTFHSAATSTIKAKLLCR